MEKEPLIFSDFIIGTMRLGEWGAHMTTNELEYFIDQCLELGLRDFDHADIYGNYSTESEFGEVLKRRPDLKKKIQVTTKCGIKMPCERRPDFTEKSYDSSGSHIISSVENSLKVLGVETLDLLLLHRPDYLLDPDEISQVIHDLKASGKILHFGVSNFSVSQVDLLNTSVPISNHQFELSLLHRNAFKNGLLDHCLKNKIKVTAWSPIGAGILFSAEGRKKFPELSNSLLQICQKYTAEVDQILLAFMSSHPADIVPVLGTSKIERIKSSLESLKINLSKEDWYLLWQSAEGQELD